GPGRALADRALESEQIDLAQRTFLHDRVHGRALDLGVVAGEVLEGRADAAILQAANDRRGEIARQHRVFGIVFIAPPAQRCSPDVDAGPGQHVNAEALALAGQRRAELVGEIDVPGAADARAVGEAGGGLHAAPGDLGIVGAAADDAQERVQVLAGGNVVVDL